MKLKFILIFLTAIGLAIFWGFTANKNQTPPPKIIFHEVNPKEANLKFYWKNTKGVNYRNFENLRNELAKNNQELIFAMNGGMYLKDLSPQGLFIENGETKNAVNPTQNAYGNFYMQPNGVFYLTKNGAAIVCKTTELNSLEHIKYATQSGPMLVIENAIHPKFIQGSNNLHIRNGVGILPSGNIIFAISTTKINFYDFASFFKNKGCQNALYLDGFVSRMYLPSKNWLQMDGNFGVIIGQTIPPK